MYAHNSGIFDIHIMMKSLFKLHLNTGSLAIPTIISDSSSNVFQFVITANNLTFIFRDSMKILPIRLDSISKNILPQKY